MKLAILRFLYWFAEGEAGSRGDYITADHYLAKRQRLRATPATPDPQETQHDE